MTTRLCWLAAGVLAATIIGSVARSADTAGDVEHDRIPWQPTLLVQLRVADLDRAVAFYSETLGFELERIDRPLKWARIKSGISGVVIGLGEGEGVEGSGTVSLNFGVGNIDRARAILESRGVVFLGPTQNIPGVVRLADFKDPDGNLIRLAGHSPGFGGDKEKTQ